MAEVGSRFAKALKIAKDLAKEVLFGKIFSKVIFGPNYFIAIREVFFVNVFSMVGFCQKLLSG